MRRFVGRLAVFVVIPVIVNLLFTLLAPIHVFTSSAWVALTPLYLKFTGPFYPDQQVTLVEEGHLGFDTPYGVPKDITFVTDPYGYRYAGSSSSGYPVVIVGDSMATGATNTQSDTPAASLSDLLGKEVYPLTPANPVTFAQDARFAANPPDAVILVRVERRLEEFLCLLPDTNVGEVGEVGPQPPIVRQTRVLVDRFLRTPEYLRLWLVSAVSAQTRASVVGEQGMLFYQPTLDVRPLEGVDGVVDRLVACDAWFAAQGIQFIFLPVPDKANIYYERASLDPSRSEFLRAVIDEATARGVVILDTQAAFEEAKAEGLELYHLDDTHWNAEGTRVAMALAAQAIEPD